MFDALSASYYWEEMPATGQFCNECHTMIIGDGMKYIVQLGSGVEMEVIPVKDTLICKPCYETKILKSG